MAGYYESYSSEDETFNTLKVLSGHLREHRINHAFMGGIAISGYAGNLIRTSDYDVDIIVDPKYSNNVLHHLLSKQFHEVVSPKTKYAKFIRCESSVRSFKKTTVDIFPGSYHCFYETETSFSTFAVYDFTTAIQRPLTKTLCGIRTNEKIEIDVLPPEDLLLSKLLPTKTPFPMLDDIFILINSIHTEDLSIPYLQQKLTENPILIQFYRENITFFQQHYTKSLWYKLNADNTLEKTLSYLHSILSIL